MFNFLGFAAQFIALISIAAIVISCISIPQSDVANDTRDNFSDAEMALIADDVLQFMVDTLTDESDATLSGTASSYCAKSMASPVYVTTIDEPTAFTYDYSAMTVKQLKALCKQQGFKHYSKLRKHELIVLLSEF